MSELDPQAAKTAAITTSRLIPVSISVSDSTGNLMGRLVSSGATATVYLTVQLLASYEGNLCLEYSTDYFTPVSVISPANLTSTISGSQWIIAVPAGTFPAGTPTTVTVAFTQRLTLTKNVGTLLKAYDTGDTSRYSAVRVILAANVALSPAQSSPTQEEIEASLLEHPGWGPLSTRPLPGEFTIPLIPETVDSNSANPVDVAIPTIWVNSNLVGGSSTITATYPSSASSPGTPSSGNTNVPYTLPFPNSATPQSVGMQYIAPSVVVVKMTGVEWDFRGSVDPNHPIEILTRMIVVS